MKALKGILGFLILAALVTGCAHKDKLRAVEGDIETPYESLGTVEVHVSTNPLKPTNAIWFWKKVFTLGFGDTSWETRLKRNLIKKAKKHWDVDQIIKVTYWPDPALNKFPKAQIFARGEMVHYKRFPEPEPSPIAE